MSTRRLNIALRATSALSLLLVPAALSANSYTQTNLVSSVTGLAANTDANLVNPWGMAFAPTGPFWTSNQATGTSTLYDGAGNKIPLTVSIPGVGGPTGQVFNNTSGFGGSHFIFDTMGGTLAAWSGGTSAVTVASTPGAVYTGLALASSGGSDYLYAADSVGGKINVFNSSFKAVSLAGSFTDPHAMSGYTPFNIQLVGSNLFVMYAKLNPDGSSQPGGYVDEFNTNGTFISRYASGGTLNAPWGIALAPSSFGQFGGDMLIANNGDGTIDAFNPITGAFVGALDGSNGKPLQFDDLWAIDFRTGGTNVNTNALYFAEGLNNDTGGLLGELTPSPEPVSIGLAGLGIAAFGVMTRLRKRKQAS